MKLNKVIIAATAIALLAMASCQKENAQVTTKPETNSTATKTISGTMANYDNSQPIGNIIADAIGERAISNPYRIILTPGTYIGSDPNGTMTVCNKKGPVCEIVFIADEKDIAETKSGSSHIISGGTSDNPIIAIQALQTWPSYRNASQVTISQTEDGASIEHVYID